MWHVLLIYSSQADPVNRWHFKAGKFRLVITSDISAASCATCFVCASENEEHRFCFMPVLPHSLKTLLK